MAAAHGGAERLVREVTEMFAKHRRPSPRHRQSVSGRFRTTSTGRRLYVASDYVEPCNKEDQMQAVGVAASIVVGLIVLAGVVLGVRSVPDLNRYLRMRQM